MHRSLLETDQRSAGVDSQSAARGIRPTGALNKPKTIRNSKATTMKMTTRIPPEITTPDAVETSLGTLKFFDGLPDVDTVQRVFDNLDRMRGVDVFLNTLAPASLRANIEGLQSVGCDSFPQSSMRTGWMPKRCCSRRIRRPQPSGHSSI